MPLRILTKIVLAISRLASSVYAEELFVEDETTHLAARTAQSSTELKAIANQPTTFEPQKIIDYKVVESHTYQDEKK